MSSRSRRLDRQFRALAPKARVGTLLRFWKRGLKPDKAIWSTLPNEDLADFDRRIDLIRAANEDAPYIALLREYVAGLEGTYELMSTRRHLGEDMRALGAYIRASMGEPVTESEYRCREQELRAVLVPVDELVAIAIERYARWTDADYTDQAGERVLSDGAWTRACNETEQELLELFRAGTLLGEQQDTGAQISAGSFYDWFGERMPVCSESGCQYEVFPDSQAEEVASRQYTRGLVEELITSAPGGADLPLELDGSRPDVASVKTAYASLERMDVTALRDGIRRRWCELRCFEIVLAELAAKEFNGEHPLRIETRKVLQDVRRHLTALHRKVTPYAGDIELPEPNPEDIALMRELVARRAER